MPPDALPCAPSPSEVKVAQSCLTLMDCSPPGSSVHGDSPGPNTGAGSCSLLQGIFPTQGSNPGLQHCRWILCHLSHNGSLQSIYSQISFQWNLILRPVLLLNSHSVKPPLLAPASWRTLGEEVRHSSLEQTPSKLPQRHPLPWQPNKTEKEKLS